MKDILILVPCKSGSVARKKRQFCKLARPKKNKLTSLYIQEAKVEKEKIELTEIDIKKIKKIQRFYKKETGIEISFDTLIHDLTNKGIDFFEKNKKNAA